MKTFTSTLVLLLLFSIGSFAQNCTITFSQQVSGNQASFVALSNVFSGSYSWDLGDGSTSTMANPTHTYSQAGTYYVCLTATVPTSAGSCTSIWCDSVTVGIAPPPPPPTPCSANFTYQPCNNPAIATGSICFHPIANTFASYNWDFGDGHSSTLANPSHTYSQAGTYYVCLTVTAPGNTGTTCTATWCDSVTVGNPPPPPPVPCNANFTYQPCNNPAIATGSICFHPIANTTFASYNWDFGDGNSSTLANPSHTYSQAGTYYVCLTVTAPGNIGTTCTATWCDSVTVGNTPPPPPVPCNANFTYQSCNNSTVAGSICFTSTPNTTVSTYLWDFGDGNSSTLANPSHTYLQAGTYFVCLTVTAPGNLGTTCTATWCDSVTVGNPPPPPPVPCNANFTYQPCNNSTVAGSICFTSTANTTVSTYLWDFGDGHSSTLANPSHTYMQAGTYYVCLTVTVQTASGTACTATWCDSVTVTVAPPPTPFNCNPNFTVQICSTTNGSLGFCFTSAANPTGTIYIWNFGDGNSSNLPNPMHTYATPGNYTVCLTVSIPTNTGTIACTATWCHSINAENAPVVNIYPNLVNEFADLTIVNATSPVDFYLYNCMGLQISAQKVTGNGVVNFAGAKPRPGLYYYYFVEEGTIISQGKLVIN